MRKEDVNRKRKAEGQENKVEAPADRKPRENQASGSGISENERKRALEGIHEREEHQKRRIDAGEQDQAAGEKRGREEGDDSDEEPHRKVFVYGMEVNQEEDNSEMFVDDRTGLELDKKLVKMAEEEEMAFMDKIGLGEECTIEECWARTGKAPVSTKFVRVDKGTPDKPDVRARLCGRDFKLKGESERCDLFAAMPPLEAKKMLFREAAK